MAKKILVVDDSALTKALISKTLSEAGYEVVNAENGAQGLLVFEKEHPDLVLTDFMMPITDGLELAEKIRARDKHVPIILISVEFNKEIKDRAQRLGINDYLFKSFEKKELLRKVDALINK